MTGEERKHIVTREVFGHDTDFLLTERVEGDAVVLTVTTVWPVLRYDGRAVQSFPPPRYPWPGVTGLRSV